MTYEFRPAKRENVPLLIGLAGGTGSGKTMSALKLARGLAGDKPFAAIDTEAGRMQHYADMFQPWERAELAPPFQPARYAEAIESADKKHYPVIVVDSFSHEWAGDGGLLDMYEAEFERLGRRDAVKMTAWIAPKREHKKMVSRLLQLRAHVILCLRAEQKVDFKRVDDKWQVVPKTTLSFRNPDGWVPICDKSFPFELTLSFLLTADAPGVPKPIKLQEQHRAFVPLDQPIGEETGQRLAEWARGGTADAGDIAFGEQEDGGASLSVTDFAELVSSANITPQKIAGVGRSLFPGRSSKTLTDVERGQLWRQLQEQVRA